MGKREKRWRGEEEVLEEEGADKGELRDWCTG